MIVIEEIKGRKALKRFVQFQLELYRGVDAFVPPMITAEIDCLDPAKNPAFEFCEAVFFHGLPRRKTGGTCSRHYQSTL